MKKNMQPFTKANLDLITNLRERGTSVAQIAEIVGISTASVYRAMEKLNLPTRNRKAVVATAEVKTAREIKVTPNPEAVRLNNEIKAHLASVPTGPIHTAKATIVRDHGNGIVSRAPTAWLTLSDDERRAKAKTKREADEKARRAEAQAIALAAIGRAIDVAKSARSAAIAEVENEAERARRDFRRLAGPHVEVSNPQVLERLTDEARAALTYTQAVEQAAWHVRKGQFVSAVATLTDPTA